ncbi:MAG: Pseudouridine synthase, Rsu [Acidobacteriaceae bacterium]|nr:Pseudouridine synthase, Rsu [Acidobacteriaceae bacterium]
MDRMPSGKSSGRTGLARALSKLGYCSRSEARSLIVAGRVSLRGKTRLDPETPVRLEKDCIQVDGKEVTSARKIYLVMNKPRGIVTTASDEKGRRTVYDVLATKSGTENLAWIAPVGRLDKASEGLLLLTNDSEWAAGVLAPENHLPKTYHVQIAALPDVALLQTLEKGAHIDGDFLHAKGVRILRAGKRNSWLEVILDEGKNRHIRRLLDHHGIEVLRLVRVAIGPLSLGKLAKGTVRPLTEEEKITMDRAMVNVSNER